MTKRLAIQEESERKANVMLAEKTAEHDLAMNRYAELIEELNKTTDDVNEYKNKCFEIADL
jgi:phage gp16-like protein